MRTIGSTARSTTGLRAGLRAGLHAGLRAGLLGAGLCLLAAGGCKWTDFDDLEEDAWVTAAQKPDNGASTWGVAIAPVSRASAAGAGTTLAVLGSSAAIYNDLAIGPGGDVNATTERELTLDFSIGNLAVEPILLTRPDADEVALVTALDASRGVALRAAAGQLTPVAVTGPALPTAATYLVAPPQMAGDPPKTQILIAQADAVFGAFFDQATAPSPQPKCQLVEDAAMAKAQVRALAAYRPDGAESDDVLAVTESGKLLAYPGAIFAGCAQPQEPTAGMTLDLAITGVQTGSQIHVFTDGGVTYALVQLHNDTGKGKLGLYRIDAGAITEIGAARDIDRLRTAALLQPAGSARRYVLAGLPTSVVDGVDAGQVQALELDVASGVAATPAMTLFDAQPEAKQLFGRSIAALPFNGKTLIAVAADNEVFVYYRTTLYAETRAGR